MIEKKAEVLCIWDIVSFRDRKCVPGTHKPIIWKHINAEFLKCWTRMHLRDQPVARLLLEKLKVLCIKNRFPVAE